MVISQLVFGKPRRAPAPVLKGEEAALAALTHLVMDIRCARKDGDVEAVREYQKALTAARAEFAASYGYEAP